MSTRLPTDIYNSYRLYKTQSNIVVKWAVTVSAPLSKLPQQASQPSPRKTGKKGRKQPPRATSQDPYNPEISLNKLLQLVGTIVEAKIQTPKEILASLSRIIWLRKATAAFFSNDADAWKKSTGHNKAIEIFMEVFKKLAGQEKADTQVKAEMDQLVTGMDEVGLEDMALILPSENNAGTIDNEWIRDNPFINRENHKTSKVRIYPLEKYVLTDDGAGSGAGGGSGGGGSGRTVAGEALFAAVCFFVDLAAVRKYCNDTWKSVEPAGPLSRITAAFVTNQAIEVVRQLEYDLKQDFIALSTTEKIYQVVSSHIGPGGDEEAMGAVYDGLFMYTYMYVRDFGDVIQDGHAPVAKEGYFGYYNPQGDRSRMSFYERKAEDVCVLMTYLPDLVAVFMLCPNDGVRKPHTFIGDDGLGMEFKRFYENRSHPVSVAYVFSCQMMLDTLYIRRTAGVDDRTAMRKLVKRITSEYNAFVTEGDLILPETMGNYLGMMGFRGAALTLQMGTDMIYQYKIKQEWQKLSPSAVQCDSLWTMNPWLCANSMAYALVDYWEVGALLCSGAGFIQSAMQLWNLLKQTGYLDSLLEREPNPETLLIEHLTDLFGEKVFRGSLPKAKFLNRWLLMLGQKAECFAPDNRMHRAANKGSHQPGGKGVLPGDSEVFTLYTSPRGLGHEIQRIEVKVQEKQKAAGSAGAIPTPIKEPYQHSILKPLSVAQRLVESELGRVAGSKALVNLDFIKIHSFCVAMFRRMWLELRHEIAAAVGVTADELQERENQLPYLTGYILLVVEMMEKAGAGLSDMTLLKKVTTVAGGMLGHERVEKNLLDL